LSPADAARPVPVSASSTTSAWHRRASGALSAVRYCRAVRLVIAKCSVDYVGRLSAHLPLAVRLLMVKADGSVSIHADDRAYKPLNWMSPPCKLQEAPGVWKVVNKAGEELRITLEEIFQDTSYDLGVDPGLVKDGVEAHLQELLAAHPETFGEGCTLVRREFMTAIGPVDLLLRDANGKAIAVEVKRRGDPLSGADEPRPVAHPGRGGVRRPGDQTAGQDAGDRPRNPMCSSGLQQTPRHGKG
jgi:RecB family endonuclease NucS